MTMKKTIIFLILLSSFISCHTHRYSAGADTGNPVFEGWYADPEDIIFGDQYWIFPT